MKQSPTARPRPASPWAVAWACAGAATPIALCAAGPASAAVIYRWVDDDGRTHYADTVPETYRQRATRIVTGAALAPAEAGHEPRAALEPVPAASAPPARAAPVPAAPTAAAKRPPQGVTATTDCATWWRLYDESVACFGPYRTAGGGVKAEAFVHCTEIPNPEPRCGRRGR